jgi:multicomponent Na+:H+ antiporter subunit F
MEMAMLEAALWILGLCMLLMVFMVWRGPTIWDRLLGLNLISSKLILCIILFAVLSDLPYLIDIAIVYALIGFIGVVFIALFIRQRGRI